MNIEELEFDAVGPAMSAADLRQLEAQLGLRLPAEYSAFLKRWNGARPRKNYVFCIITPHTDVMLRVLYGAGVGVPSIDIVHARDRFGSDLPSARLEIGRDPGGNPLLLSLDDGGVYYFDWNRTVGDVVQEYLVARSFGRFLSGLSPLGG